VIKALFALAWFELLQCYKSALYERYCLKEQQLCVSRPGSYAMLAMHSAAHITDQDHWRIDKEAAAQYDGHGKQ
jgi:hypothetical protein